MADGDKTSGTATPTPSPESAPVVEAAKVDAEKQAAIAAAEAAKTAAESKLKQSASADLANLRASITAPSLEAKDKETLLSKAKEKVGKHEAVFTKKDGKAFFDGILAKAKADLASEKDGEKKAVLYADDVSKKFCDQFMQKYYFLFVDGVPDNVELKVIIEKGAVKIDEVDSAKVQAARDTAKSKIEAAAATTNVSQEISQFEKEHPEAFLFLKQVVFKDDAEMKEAFKGNGLIGFFLGVLGYGGGKTMYGAIMKMDWFSKHHDSLLDSFAKLHPSLDFRKAIELEKNEDLNEYYNNPPKEELRFVGKKFVARNAIKLQAMTTFRYIVFPKGSDKVSFPGMLKKGAEVRSLARDERHENITVPANTTLEAGTVFSDIEIGNKVAIEAAKRGEPAPAAAAVTPTPAPAPSPAPATAPVPAVAPLPAPSAPAPAASVPKGEEPKVAD